MIRFVSKKEGMGIIWWSPSSATIVISLISRDAYHRKGNKKDGLLLVGIRRVVLDSFWARERPKVQINLVECQRLLMAQETLGSGVGNLPCRGPYPPRDDWGVTVACNMMTRSLDPGRRTTHVSYEALQKMKKMYEHYSHSCCNGTGATLINDDGNVVSRVSNSVTNSFWFKQFNEGCRLRMEPVTFLGCFDD